MSAKINTRPLLLFILFIGIICSLLYRDIGNRLYSFIGDEYAFYYTAKNIATRGTKLKYIFSQNGVYGYHPVADSLAVAASMRIFGVNITGWKMLNILIVAFVSWLIYHISLLLFKDYAAALASSVLFAGNRYLFAFAHIGYNNLHALLPSVFALWAYVRYQKTAKKRYVVLAGISSGLLLYTFFTARLMLCVIFPLLLMGTGGNRKLYILTFLAVVFPFILINGRTVITAPLGNHIISNSISPVTIARSLVRSVQDILIPGHMRTNHFVYGPPISYFLLITSTLGLILLAYKRQYKLLSILLILSLGFTVIIITTYYSPDLPITRLHIILPALAVAGGYIFQFLPKKHIITPLFCMIFLAVELYQFYVIMPRIQPIRKEALAMQVIEQNHGKILCMNDSDRKNFWYIFDAYQETIRPYSITPDCDLVIASFGRLSPDRFDDKNGDYIKQTAQDRTHQTAFTYYVRK